MRVYPLILGLVLTTSAAAFAQETSDEPDAKVCLLRADFQRFLDIAIERQCLERRRPTFEVDPITVLTDSDGRVFYSGADPSKPYQIKMKWCHYDVVADGKVSLLAAMQTPPTAGVRFRPKAYLGYLPLKLTKAKLNDGVDAGLLIDWLFIHEFNVNVSAGFRSLGLGLGVDLTQNFGVYAGYALGYAAPVHNVNVSLYFAF